MALVAKMKGYNIILVIPDKMSQEKINHLRALGAEIIITRSDVGKGHPEYYQDLAKKLAKERNAYFINQFENPSNPLAHETTTGPEIWEQMQHNVDAIVVGVGSSGTITGLSRFFNTVSKKTEIILADPKGSVLADYVNNGNLSNFVGSWIVEGIGEDFIPPIADLSFTKKAFTITDKESVSTVSELLQKEGILAGSSTGTLLCAALKYCKEQKTEKRVITFACDSGNKYLSKMYNNFWLLDNGLYERKKYSDIRDIISRRFEDGDTIILNHNDTLNTAFSRMKLYDISQLPVFDGEKLVGIVDETDILIALSSSNSAMNNEINSIMASNLVTVKSGASISTLIEILKSGLVVIVEDYNNKFCGIITKIDLINYLRNEKR
ncbi:MAG: cystathionine beta-synthase [Bacteroidetes bacterium GWA2_30_7]|nr:MAG: cystathionine beta-synthase [Bacteroidetes bacterium GWA2_30_7]